MNTFLFCFVLAVGLASQAVTGTPLQQNQAPTGQGNANAISGEPSKKAIDDLTKLINDVREQIQSTLNVQKMEDFFKKHDHMFSKTTKNKYNKLVGDFKNAETQANLSGATSDFNGLIAAVGDDISKAVQTHAKDIPNSSEILERINNFVKQVTKP
ncbi:host translation inhibitory factor II, partial [Bracoviriform glomeratae]